MKRINYSRVIVPVFSEPCFRGISNPGEWCMRCQRNHDQESDLYAALNHSPEWRERWRVEHMSDAELERLAETIRSPPDADDNTAANIPAPGAGSDPPAKIDRPEDTTDRVPSNHWR